MLFKLVICLIRIILEHSCLEWKVGRFRLTMRPTRLIYNFEQTIWNKSKQISWGKLRCCYFSLSVKIKKFCVWNGKCIYNSNKLYEISPNRYHEVNRDAVTSRYLLNSKKFRTFVFGMESGTVPSHY